MAKDISVALAVQVEVGVVGKVDHGGLVGLGRKEKLEGVVLAPLVACDYLKVARISSLSVLGEYGFPKPCSGSIEDHRGDGWGHY